MISIFNYPKSFSIPQETLCDNLLKAFQSQFKLQNISIIFIPENEIKELNKKYRGVSEVTDVLSFNFDSQELLGEVYVCLDYVQKTSKDENEIYRIIIHGILHLLGFDHVHEFVDLKSKTVENMYIIQESILDNLVKRLK